MLHLLHLALNTLRGGHAQHGGGRKAPLLGLVLGAALGFGLPATAQDSPLPPRFATMLDNTDLPGGDLTPIFNTNLAQCHAACLRDTECTAFTFNQRAGACFPKSQPGAATPFEGALVGADDRTVPCSADPRGANACAHGLSLHRRYDRARAQAETMAERYYANGMTEAALLDGATGDRAVLFTGAAVTVADSGAHGWSMPARCWRGPRATTQPSAGCSARPSARPPMPPCGWRTRPPRLSPWPRRWKPASGARMRWPPSAWPRRCTPASRPTG